MMSMRTRSIGRALVALGTLLAVSLPAALGQAENGADSEIERVVLYKHGLGYFERNADVTGEATLSLTFKHDQMKDILKSFYAVDLGGGRIANISYDSAAPLEKQLEEILLRVPADQSLTGLLTRLQGARIRLQLPGETIEGQVLGLEEEKRQTEGGTTITMKYVTLLLADGSIRAILLTDVRGFSILDDALRADVKRYLDLTLQGKYKDRKTVKVYAVGEGQRSVRMGYLLETPVWKTSYRLLFQEEGQPVLQGWAMVENPTDEDWEKVDLQLVAGNPISFVMDLYQPYYPVRPVVPLDVLFPDVDVRAGVPIPREPPRAPAAESRRAREAMDEAEEDFASRGGDGGGAPGGKAGAEKGLQTLAGIESAAKGTALGEMFAYAIQEPVSVPRGQSALVPILSTKVDGERLLYYQERISAHPMNAFRLENSTGLTLDNGPVTVFEGSASLGEGLLHQTLQPGMKSVVTFAVETGVDVEKTVEADQRPIHRIALVDGVMTWHLYTIQATKYRIVNRTRKETTLLLDHFPRPGHALVEPEKPEEELPGVLRFRMRLASGAPTDFLVKERREVSQAVRLDRGQVQQIRVLLEQPVASKEMKEFLSGLLEIMEAIRKAEVQIAELESKRTSIERDQGRYRENMARLGDTQQERELRSQYVGRLASSEEELGQIRTRLDEAATTKRELDTKLAERIRSARFE